MARYLKQVVNILIGLLHLSRLLLASFCYFTPMYLCASLRRCLELQIVPNRTLTSLASYKVSRLSVFRRDLKSVNLHDLSYIDLSFYYCTLLLQG